MDVLKVVQQLRDLAVDPHNRATIVRVSYFMIVIQIYVNVVLIFVAECLFVYHHWSIVSLFMRTVTGSLYTDTHC